MISVFVTFGMLAGILILMIITLWLVWKMRAGASDRETRDELVRIRGELLRIDPLLRDEFSRNREEAQKGSKENREELSASLRTFTETLTAVIRDLSQSQKNQFDLFSSQLQQMSKMLTESLERLMISNERQLTALKEEFVKNTTESRTEITESVKVFKADTEAKLELIRETVERRLQTLQDENLKKLDEMRATVDEKLQSTLEKRLTESFKQVSERLEMVHNGLGEMRNLAVGVGDLKKVLSNVKTRGILGEIQLGNILENILAPEQFERNFVTKSGSRENVEFAVKLPSKDEDGTFVFLPMDSKFPIEAYHSLLDAYDTGNAEQVRVQTKAIENEIKRCSKDIRDKYINPPHTTDFGILFLPVEGLYAEVVRNTSLIETLQRDYKIVITGPTTLAALLNSLQMGFRTLAIQKRSSEVWQVLGAIKTEFGKFGEVLTKAQEKINKASEDLDTLVGVRTKKIQSRLRRIDELPDYDAKMLLEGEPTQEDMENNSVP